MINFDPVDIDRDLVTVHRWVRDPHAAFWMMQEATPQDVRRELTTLTTPPHRAFLGRLDGRPVALLATYDPASSPLDGIPELRPGDLGMHILIAPATGERVPGFTTEVFRDALALCFSDPTVARVVVEPDVRNEAVRRKNVQAGFEEVRPVELPDKTAIFSVCEKAAFQHAAAVDHLTPRNLDAAQRRLVAKAIGEYTHERLIAPQPLANGRWRLETAGSVYTFTARRYALDHWVVEPATIRRESGGRRLPVDAQDLVAELAPALGVPDKVLPVYVEEVASTLAAASWTIARKRHTAASLASALTDPHAPVDKTYQLLEGAMTEGHPAFVANNGRIGFGVDDYARYAPEVAEPVRLHWVAVRRSHGVMTLGEQTDESAFYRAELGASALTGFRRRLEAHDLDPDDYFYLPVHPWQWQNKLAITLAPDVARRDVVDLGIGADHYVPQQSIRTFFNTTHPERHYVKTALSIQNMGFVRGLSPAYMRATPAINDWVAGLVRADPELRTCGFDVLREVAAAGYTGDAFHRHTGHGPHQKMLAALWRESPLDRVRPGEHLTTMAALLHRDRDGHSLAGALLRASGLCAEEWVRSYLTAYLRPLVHCLLAYNLAFMPHGENLILVLRDGVPQRVLIKDVGEEVAVMGDLPLPSAVERIRAHVPDPATRALAIHTDVLDGVLRFVAAILDADGALPEADFWRICRDVVTAHAADHPELAREAAEIDLLRPYFAHSCLNRLQLRNATEMVDITDQESSLLFAGEMPNPIARDDEGDALRPSRDESRR